ncbi:MAG: hypothetical protein ACLFRR_03055 [Spirochaetaceae bacterium]
MEQITGVIRLDYTDPAINEIIEFSTSDPVGFTRHFDQNEDFFLRLPAAFSVPPLPIHHDVQRHEPPRGYLEALRKVMRTLVAHGTTAFGGLLYLFDPREVQHPVFYAVRRFEERWYLYLLRLDLSFRPTVHEIIEPGSNDVSPAYRSDRLYLEADLVPLERLEGDPQAPEAFVVEQIVENTWIGETGRGYFVQGIWLDRDLTKFFSKLFLTPGSRTYPYYPITCKYRSVCHTIPDISPQRRWASLPRLAVARGFIKPRIEQIEAALEQQEFSEELDTFQALKEEVRARGLEEDPEIRVRAYLNDNDMKEFVVEG